MPANWLDRLARFRDFGAAAPISTSHPEKVATSLFALEPRMLFDGALAASADPTDDAAVPQTVDPARVAGAAAGPGPADARQLLVIDESVQDWQVLVQDLGPDVEILLLDGDRNGVQQIADALGDTLNNAVDGAPEHAATATSAVDGRGPVSALHIVSHGAAGQLKLGDAVVDIHSLSQFDLQWQAIGSAMTDSADILLYGCDGIVRRNGRGIVGRRLGA